MSLIDTHCHLDRFAPQDHPDLLKHARDASLRGILTVGTRLSEADRQIALTDLSSSDLAVWCTIGTHPDHVGEEGVPRPEVIASRAELKCVIGIGETGLDYFHGAPDTRQAQRDSFCAHLRAARLAGIPLVIHTREADRDMIAILQDEHRSGGRFRFLLHCFSSGPELAACALELGGSLSFSGMVTFPKLAEVREVARMVPDDRLLVETDAPFLAPVPRRGRQNEPSYIVHTVAALAALRGTSIEDLGGLTTANFFRLFSKAS